MHELRLRFAARQKARRKLKDCRAASGQHNGTNTEGKISSSQGNVVRLDNEWDVSYGEWGAEEEYMNENEEARDMEERHPH